MKSANRTRDLHANDEDEVERVTTGSKKHAALLSLASHAERHTLMSENGLP